MTRVESRRNPLVRHVSRLLAEAGYRAECGEFAAEGTKLLYDALEADVALTAVLVDESADVEYIERCVAPHTAARVAVLPSGVFSGLSTQKSPQGVVFAARMPRPSELEARLVLDGVQDPGNVGTVLRTAAAFGLEAVLLTGGCADPFSPKTVRASMGGVFRVGVLRCAAEEVSLHVRNRRLLVATPAAGAAGVREVDWSSSVAVIGSEGRGVSEVVRRQCVGEYTIPIRNAESLNAGVAAAITMWEMTC